MYVVGLTSATTISAVGPMSLMKSTCDLYSAWVLSGLCRRASSSSTHQPALWRVPAYFAPGLPRPKMMYSGLRCVGWRFPNSMACTYVKRGSADNVGAMDNLEQEILDFVREEYLEDDRALTPQTR